MDMVLQASTPLALPDRGPFLEAVAVLVPLQRPGRDYLIELICVRLVREFGRQLLAQGVRAGSESVKAATATYNLQRRSR
jgi:hypothetical protein